MDEYISKQTFKEKYLCCGWLPEMSEEEFDAFPAADVRPVVRGRWSEKPYLLGTTNVCSVCGENYGMPHGKYNFCPNCGADMRGGSGDEE